MIDANPSIRGWVWYTELLSGIQMVSICVSTKTGFFFYLRRGLC